MRYFYIVKRKISCVRKKHIVINDEQVIESGMHNELLANGGFYAILYNSQFRKEIAI